MPHFQLKRVVNKKKIPSRQQRLLATRTKFPFRNLRLIFVPVVSANFLFVCARRVNFLHFEMLPSLSHLPLFESRFLLSSC